MLALAYRAPGAARAQGPAGSAYPNRPVRVLVPAPPGASADATARVVAESVASIMGQAWVVDNRGGAGGNMAAEAVARAAPDGYTVMVGMSTIVTVNPSLYKLPFSVEKDLQPVSTIASSEFVLLANPKLPVKNLKELVEYAKQNPGKLNIASAGVGTAPHMGAELLKRRLGIEMTHVPFRGGGPANAAVIAGDCDLVIASTGAVVPYVQSGQMRALASAGLTRSRLLPDLPTIAESGYPGFEVTVWYGLFAPYGTPKPVVERLRTDTLKAIQQPDIVAKLAKQGLEVQTSTPEELAARIKTETNTWAGIIKEAGIKID